MKHLKSITLKKLQERGIQLKDIADIVYLLQKSYFSDISIEECIKAIDKVLNKREVIYIVLTAIALDECVEKKKLEYYINDIIECDYSLYGVDEVLGLGIINIYGSIALTNFGYLDKTKPGIIGKIDEQGKKENVCHTFLDDIICALAGAAASIIAHKKAN